MLRRPPRSTLTDPLFPNTTLCRSKDGTRLLYAVQDGGTDWRVVRVKDVATGEDLPDEVRWVKFSALDWAKDGSGFYYSRFPAPEQGETFQSLNENQAVYFHKLGTPQSDDVPIHATPDKPALDRKSTRLNSSH